MGKPKSFRIAAVADMHYGKHSKGQAIELLERVSHEADVLLLCGDLTDYGLPEEARLLADDIHGHCRVPVVAVLGNHDYESDQPHAIREVMEEAGVIMLNGESCELDGVGFAGVSGFGGGFGRRMLNAWGEPLMKQFVREAVEQELKLEQALMRLRTPHKIAVLHYSPIRETVQGEDPEIFPFLGSSRLEEPINRFRVSAVFHGHAHKGALAGHTSAKIPVFNVSIPLLTHSNPKGPPFKLFELKMAGGSR